MVGVLSTLTVPVLISRLGLASTGHFALLLQSLCLSVAVASFYVSLQRSSGLCLLFIGLCSSRYGLWAFDLVETQLMQEGVKEGQVGAISGLQESLVNAVTAGSFLLTVVWSRPADILWPVWVSMGSVLLATALYSRWTAGQEREKERRGRQQASGEVLRGSELAAPSATAEDDKDSNES